MYLMDMKKTAPRPGLTQGQVDESRRLHGANILTRKKGKSFIRRFFGNLNDPIIRILIGALVVNLIFSFRDGNFTETIGIGAAVLIAALISTISEHSSENAFSKLDEGNETRTCRVRRSGVISEIPVREIVVGDIVLLQSGDTVPADSLLISGEISVDQSALTGESLEIAKHPGQTFRADPSDRSSVFRGCGIISGEGEAVVGAVGDATFIGEISLEIQEDPRESPLRRRLTKLAKQISIIGYIMAALVALAYLFNVFVLDSGFAGQAILLKFGNVQFLVSKLISAFTLGLTVIVMAVPEGLPMMIAVVLASNLRRMMKDNVLVRKAAGIEAAGSMNILFTDKTGTLTEGRPGLCGIVLGDGTAYSSFEDLERHGNPTLLRLFLLSSYYNTSSALSGAKVSGGNSTDRALLEAVKRSARPGGYSVVSRTPFDSRVKTSSVSLTGKESLTLMKGAPEKLLPAVKAFIDKDGKVTRGGGEALMSRLSSLMADGNRVIAVTRRVGNETAFVCAVLLRDRLRPESRGAVRQLSGAGIHTVMITGDNKATAARIAADCGLMDDGGICVTSEELSRMSDLRLREILPRLSVVARALPTDKSRLVRVAQEAGLVVGMTGDGVNDAPALRKADVGFAMGSGTQVSKEAGDIIILDDNLTSIVKAVLYGRTVFKSIRKFICLQLTMNFCACGISMIGPFIGFDSPVTVIQMLWINIIMDTLGGLAFAGEAPSARFLREKPKRRDEPILNRYMIFSLILHSGFTLALGVAFLKMPAITGRFRASEGNICLLTAYFAFFIFSSVFNCFCARTDRLNLFSGLQKNRVFILIMAAVCAIQTAFIYLGGAVLRTVPLTPAELAFTLLLSLLVIPADFLRKLAWRFGGNREGY